MPTTCHTSPLLPTISPPVGPVLSRGGQERRRDPDGAPGLSQREASHTGPRRAAWATEGSGGAGAGECGVVQVGGGVTQGRWGWRVLLPAPVLLRERGAGGLAPRARTGWTGALRATSSRAPDSHAVAVAGGYFSTCLARGFRGSNSTSSSYSPKTASQYSKQLAGRPCSPTFAHR